VGLPAALRSVRRWGLARPSHRFPCALPQVIKGSGGGVSPESLDFFGRKGGAPLGSAEEGWGLAGAGEEVTGREQQEKEDGAGKKDGERAGKRKRPAEVSERKRKKKKTRGICIRVRVSLAEYPDEVHASYLFQFTLNPQVLWVILL